MIILAIDSVPRQSQLALTGNSNLISNIFLVRIKYKERWWTTWHRRRRMLEVVAACFFSKWFPQSWHTFENPTKESVEINFYNFAKSYIYMFFHSEWKTWSKYPTFLPIRSNTFTDQISKSYTWKIISSARRTRWKYFWDPVSYFFLRTCMN